MWRKLQAEIDARGIATPPRAIVSERDLAALPATARRLMRFHGVTAGSAKVGSFLARWTGEFRLGSDKPWMPIEAVQCDVREPVARIFLMRARMNRVLPILARDTYVGGHGRMRARMAGFVPIVDATGPELDQGELVTWVNDCILLEPSMLLGEKTKWERVDDHCFALAFTDGACAVKARVFVDETGAPIDFETTDRFLDGARTRWRTPVRSWQRMGARVLPAHAEARWVLPKREFAYARFDLVDYRAATARTSATSSSPFTGLASQ